jgi:CUB/sushi domain-containing protein
LLNGIARADEEKALYEGSDPMSVDLCHHFCSGSKKIYFGLKGSECMCFDTYVHLDVGSMGCNIQCAGNANDTCGGSGAYSVHMIYMWAKKLKMKSCGAPPVVPNAASQCEDGGGEGGATNCPVTCASGYGLAANQLLCDTRSGMWVGHALCEEISCHKPPRILNAMSWCHSGKSLQNDGGCEVKCLPGFELTKNDLRCVTAGGLGAVGAFTGEAVCAAKSCGTPPARVFANFASVPISFPNHITYTCKPGYTLNSKALGNKVLFSTCQQDGEFTELDAAEQCQGVRCLAPPMLDNGRVLMRPEREGANDQTVRFGEQVTYACDKGFSTDGTAAGIAAFSIACQETGLFTPIPKCQKLFCGIPPMFAHATAVEGTNLTALQYCEDVVEYQTNTGYSLNKTDINLRDFALTCQYDGYFGGWPTITPVSCGFPPAAENALVAEGEIFYPNFAEYTCVTGHTTTGQAGGVAGAFRELQRRPLLRGAPHLQPRGVPHAAVADPRRVCPHRLYGLP